MITEQPLPRRNGYEPFFGFAEPPFSLSANPRFRFASAGHEEALSEVTYGLERREPVIVVTGDIGMGKTLLCRTVLQRLPRKTFLSVITDPLLGRDDFLKRILEDFGIIAAERAATLQANRHDLTQAMDTFLLSLAQLDAHAVVIIDEAQHVHPEVLEQIRLVANAHDTLLQIVLVGQPSLQTLLGRSELRQVRQRVTRCVSVNALTDDEVKQYIAHRLAVAREPETSSRIAGADDLAREMARWNESRQPVTFSDGAIDAVARLSRGTPRIVNLLCDRALEATFADRSRTVGAQAIEGAARSLQLADLGGDIIEPAPTSRAPRASRYAVGIAALVLVGAIVWFGGRQLDRGRSVQRPTSVVTLPPSAAGTTPSPPAPAPSSFPAQIEAVPLAAAEPPNPSAAAATAATSDGFEILVASFRTEVRATEVVEQLTSAGQRVRQRSVGAWQQVVAGPFASRTAAEDAQRLLEREGFAGTQIVSSAR
ncbi:MAG TPA: AAA family ATPase [Vicinamibacterales bacterium]|nr:AAA family ATPase [Vicinamibacterales bacterium]